MKAFPLHEDQTPSEHMPQQGMDLRDYFAAKAMSTLIKGAGNFSSESLLHGDADDIARDAYVIADAMLKARQQCN